MSGEKTYRMYHMAKSVGMNTSEFMRLLEDRGIISILSNGRGYTNGAFEKYTTNPIMAFGRLGC